MNSKNYQLKTRIFLFLLRALMWIVFTTEFERNNCLYPPWETSILVDFQWLQFQDCVYEENAYILIFLTLIGKNSQSTFFSIHIKQSYRLYHKRDFKMYYIEKDFYLYQIWEFFKHICIYHKFYIIKGKCFDI